MSFYYIWVLIPLAGVVAGMFKDFLKFKASQEKLGVSAKALEQQVAQLEATNDRLVQRVENLEAVVTSRFWHSVDAPAGTAEHARLDIALGEIEPEKPSAERRMKRLAEGLR